MHEQSATFGTCCYGAACGAPEMDPRLSAFRLSDWLHVAFPLEPKQTLDVSSSLLVFDTLLYGKCRAEMVPA